MESLLLITAVPGWGGWVEREAPGQDGCADGASSLSDNLQVSPPPIQGDATESKLEMGASCALNNIPIYFGRKDRPEDHWFPIPGSTWHTLVMSSPPPDSAQHVRMVLPPASGRWRKILMESLATILKYRRGPEISCFLLKEIRDQ